MELVRKSYADSCPCQHRFPNFIDSSYSFLTEVDVDYGYRAALVISVPAETARSSGHRRDSAITTAQNGAPLTVAPLLCAHYSAIASLGAHLSAPCQWTHRS